MKFSRNFLILAAFFLFFTGALTPTAEGDIAAPVVFEHIKSDGRVVFYALHGDEFLNYMADAYGNMVAFGDDGELYFAKWVPKRAFWDDYYEYTSLQVPTDRKPKGVPRGTSMPEYNDMPPLRTPVPEYIRKNAQSLRQGMMENRGPTVSTIALPGGVKGELYGRTLRIYDTGHTQLSWSIDGGSLPDGLSLSAAGEISGTPLSEGVYNFTVKVENPTGSDTQELSIAVTLYPEEERDEQDGYEPYEPLDEELPDNGGGGCSAATGALIIIPAVALLFKRKS